MKKVFFIASLSFFYFPALFGQKVSYTPTVDDPAKLNNISVRLYPFASDFYFGKKTKRENLNDSQEGTNPQITLGTGFELDFDEIPVLNKRLGAQLKYRKSYLEVTPTKIDGENIRLSHFEIGANYKLRSKTFTKANTLKVSETLFTVSSLGDVPMQTQNEWNARVGLMRVKSPVSFDYGLYTHASIVTSTAFYAGFEFTQATNFKAKVNGFGTAKHSQRVSWYTDFVIAPRNTFEEVSYVPFGELEPTVFDSRSFVDSLGLENNMGLRTGIKVQLNPSNLIGFEFTGELGVRPPLAGVHFLMAFAITVNLNARKE